MQAAILNFPLRIPFAQWLASWRGLPKPAVQVRSAADSLASRWFLPLHHTRWIEAARPGLEITCIEGWLWLTYDGQQRDIVLAPGETHVCDQPGRLAVHALHAGELLVRS